MNTNLSSKNSQTEGYNSPSPKNPQSTDRGVLNTQIGLEALIDWVSFTIPSMEVTDAIDVLQIPEHNFVQMSKGGLGYKGQMKYGHISIFYDGKDNMGVHVQMSGQGCREYEAISPCWPDLITRIFAYKGHFSRVDLALDDYDEHFTLEMIREKINKREVKTRYRKARVLSEIDLNEPSEDRNTIYFGSPQSESKIRIYNKGLKEGVNYPWIRTEIECKNERATLLAHHILNNDIRSVVSGVLNNYLSFVEPTSDKNKARWPVSDWWLRFIGNAERLKLSIKKATSSIEKTKEWIEKQIAPSLALVFKYVGGDLEYIDDLLLIGESKLSRSKLALLHST